MQRKKELFARISRRLDIPREALPGGFGMSLAGQRELTVRGCRRILSYGAECIRLSLGKTAVAICGESLLCTVFEAGSVTVEGRILSISFEEGGERHAT